MRPPTKATHLPAYLSDTRRDGGPTCRSVQPRPGGESPSVRLGSWSAPGHVRGRRSFPKVRGRQRKTAGRTPSSSRAGPGSAWTSSLRNSSERMDDLRPPRRRPVIASAEKLVSTHAEIADCDGEGRESPRDRPELFESGRRPPVGSRDSDRGLGNYGPARDPSFDPAPRVTGLADYGPGGSRERVGPGLRQAPTGAWTWP